MCRYSRFYNSNVQKWSAENMYYIQTFNTGTVKSF